MNLLYNSIIILLLAIGGFIAGIVIVSILIALCALMWISEKESRQIARPVFTHHDEESLLETRAINITNGVRSANLENLNQQLGYIKAFNDDYGGTIRGKEEYDKLIALYDLKERQLFGHHFADAVIAGALTVAP